MAGMMALKMDSQGLPIVDGSGGPISPCVRFSPLRYGPASTAPNLILMIDKDEGEDEHGN